MYFPAIAVTKATQKAFILQSVPMKGSALICI